jgi:hypothetical protein
MEVRFPSRMEDTCMRPGYDGRLDTPPGSTWGRFTRRGPPSADQKGQQARGGSQGERETGEDYLLLILILIIVS